MNTTLQQVVSEHLSRIYPHLDFVSIAADAIKTMGLDKAQSVYPLHQNKWTQQDAWVITYGDSIQNNDEPPLKTLKYFADTYLKESITGLHILPFFPYSSDEGFSVIDYSQVNDSLGTWGDIEAIGKDYDLMADLVVNHCSQRSRWFDNFRQCKDPGKDYFIEASPDDDLSKVVRPRTSALLRETQTLDGTRHVWCTFSHDQVDLNFKNPDVFLQMMLIVRRYLEQEVKIFRLDAVAFLWKEKDTACVHLPQTHEFVRLIRTLVEAHTSDAIVITETNVPVHENLSYLGNANEAHAVYNFSLPPLLIHALISGTSEHLKRWQMSMPPAQNGTFYFNFIASHDGIGLRPVVGLLDQDAIDQLVNTMQSFGARVSWRAIANGKNEPYEINVALYDALQGTHEGADNWQLDRYVCAHAIMFALEGIPGIYIHSMLGTQNDFKRLELTNHNRNINRHKWSLKELESKLNNPNSQNAKVLQAVTKLLKLRAQHSAFHPNAVQFTLHLGDKVFGFWRQSTDRKQSIFCIHNISNQNVCIPISSINLVAMQAWSDLVSNKTLDPTETELTLAPYQFVWLCNAPVQVE